jgi:sodium-coupled neutral amino acid transporter 11
MVDSATTAETAAGTPPAEATAKMGLGLEHTVLGLDKKWRSLSESQLNLLTDDDGSRSSPGSPMLAVSIRPAEDEYADTGGHSSIAEASFNFVNSIVGAGMIGIPFALAEAGLVTGVFLLVLVGILTDYSIGLLIKYGLKCGKMTYQDMVQHYLGNKGFILLTIMQFLFPFSAMCAYSIIIGQTYPAVFEQIGGEDFFMTDRSTCIVVMTFALMVPLSLKSELEGLAQWSALAIFGVLFLGVALISSGASVDEPDNRGPPMTVIRPNIAQAIGVMATAYVCHHNSFLVYESLKDASEARFSKVTHYSIGSSFVLMTVVGIAGYWPFGADTCANVLKNFPEADNMMTAGRTFYGITVMMTYPIECFVCREVIANTFFRGAESLSRWQHFAVTLPVCLVVLAIALATADLGLVLELNGVVCANTLAFILPSMMAISSAQMDGEATWTFANAKPIALLSFGGAVLTVGLVLILLEANSDEEKEVDDHCV